VLVPIRTGVAFLLGAVAYTFILYFLSGYLGIHGGEVVQALYVLFIGIVGLAVYAAIILAISTSMRTLVRFALTSLKK
nr:hypothetical protein [Nitrososphaerota archaeon]